MVDGIIEKLNFVKALKRMEDRGTELDFVFGILILIGLIVSAVFSVIAFVQWEASAQFIRFLIVAYAAWAVPTMLVNYNFEKIEDENEGDK